MTKIVASKERLVQLNTYFDLLSFSPTTEEDLNGALNEMSRTLQDFFEQEKESDQAEHLDNTEQIL